MLSLSTANFHSQTAQMSCFAPIHLPVDLVPFAELAFAPLVLDLSPSPPPPEPHPSAPEMPVPQQAEESVIEDPHPTSVEDTLPPIQRAAAMHEHIAESAGDASTQAKVAQRLLPAHIPSEMLDVSSAELRRLSPKQYVQEQLHLLLPDPYQAHSDEAGEAHLEAAAAQLSESDRQMHLAASEQRPSVVAAARQMEAEQPLFSELEKFFAEEEQEHLVLAEVVGGGAEEAEEQPLFDIDLGAFELVDSGITAEELLTNEDPVIYHKDMPVHSVHHDTVQTEAAIANLMNAPQSMLSTQVPPTMVADNYCFAVDADRIQMADIMGDEHWWRHTSRPTKYFYSKDLRRFYRVNCLAARGKILSARLANTTPAMGGGQCTAEMMGPELGSCSGESFSTGSFARRSITFGAGGTSEGRPSIAPSVLSPPLVQPAGSSSSAFPMPSSSLHAPHLPSIGGPSPRGSIAAFSQHQMQQQQQQMMAQWRQCPDAQRGEIVDLGDVYRVVRFYSFWRTCTSFHRIVTMIERVGFSSSSLVERSSSQPRLNRPPSSEQPHTLPPSSTVSESSSSAAAKSMSRFGSARSVPDFQKRLFVQYLWRNAKASDKARVQREFDPRRQRLLRFVPTDPNARKKMTSAKAQWRNSSTGQSMEKQSKFSHLTPPTSATMPGYGSPSSSVRWRVPPQEAAERARSPASGGRPQSTPISPLRRAKTSADVSPR